MYLIWQTWTMKKANILILLLLCFEIVVIIKCTSVGKTRMDSVPTSTESIPGPDGFKTLAEVARWRRGLKIKIFGSKPPLLLRCYRHDQMNHHDGGTDLGSRTWPTTLVNRINPKKPAFFKQSINVTIQRKKLIFASRINRDSLCNYMNWWNAQ